MSARGTLVQYLRDVVGDDGQVIEVEDNTDVLGVITLMVKQRTLQKLAQAPMGALRVDFIVSVTHPATDAATAEPALDDFVPSLLSEMSEKAGFSWTTATKFGDGDNLGYDIECAMIVGPVKPAPAPEAEGDSDA